MKEDIEHAIKNRLKIKFQMIDTPEGKYILFHPYAALLDLFDGLSFIGLVEHHHTNPIQNYIARPKFAGIKSVQVLDEHFEPNHDLWKNLKLDTIDLLSKA